nr:reverse transcriptase domain-containing protein [Tanacetum cinerariifolium]
MKESVNVVVQLQTNKLREEAQAENQDFLNQVNSTMKKIIKDQVKEQVSKMMPKIEKYVIETLGAVLVRTTNQSPYAVAASLSKFKLKKILIDKMEANKSINRSDTQKNLYNALVESYNSDKDIIISYGDVVLLKRRRDDQDKDEDPSVGSDQGTGMDIAKITKKWPKPDKNKHEIILQKSQEKSQKPNKNEHENGKSTQEPEIIKNQSSTLGTLSSNTIPNPKGEMKAITTRSGVSYEGPSIPTPKKTLPKPNIPYPLRLNDQKHLEKATNQMEKFFQIFQDLHCDISFVDALLLMLKFASTIKSLLKNKDKLFELAKIPLNENCSAMLLKKLLEKLGNPGKFLIHCDFSRMDVCHALADLADRSITRPKGVAKDVFVKVGKFHFLTDFVVMDFEADPRVPLILGRSFLRIGRALIDIYGEEITLRVNDEAVTFNLNQTMRYSSTYDDLSVNRIDIIDVSREKYAQEILGFSSNSSGDNPISTFEPILFDSSLSLTPFEGSDFILEEIDAYLKDESVLLEIDHADCDPEGDIF